MKLTIEISDKALHEAVNDQVSKAIAEMSESAIKSKIDEIVLKKFDRLSPEKIANDTAKSMLKERIDEEIENLFGRSYQRGDKLRKIFSEVAEKMLKASVK